MRFFSALAVGLALVVSCGYARASDCANPNALGVSRKLAVDPTADHLIGTMQYPSTLPLADHEVVLTFDDGPLPRYSNAVLDILASECVTATYFMVGEMARQFPGSVRKAAAAGHTIGTHSENHPLSFNRMPMDRARDQIETGIASVSAALGDAGEVAPFFRIPGLLRREAVENYLIDRHISVFSADVVGDDWRHIRAREVARRTIQRLESKRRGIILLHDIHAVTVMALPTILRELKQRGYHVVHLVPKAPATPLPDVMPTPPFRYDPGTEPEPLELAATADRVAK